MFSSEPGRDGRRATNTSQPSVEQQLGEVRADEARSACDRALSWTRYEERIGRFGRRERLGDLRVARSQAEGLSSGGPRPPHLARRGRTRAELVAHVGDARLLPDSGLELLARPRRGVAASDASRRYGSMDSGSRAFAAEKSPWSAKRAESQGGTNEQHGHERGGRQARAVPSARAAAPRPTPRSRAGGRSRPRMPAPSRSSPRRRAPASTRPPRTPPSPRVTRSRHARDDADQRQGERAHSEQRGARRCRAR